MDNRPDHEGLRNSTDENVGNRVKGVDQRELLPLIMPDRTIKDLVTETGYRGPIVPFVKETVTAWQSQAIDTEMPKFLSKWRAGEIDEEIQTDAVQIGAGMIHILGVLHDKPTTPYSRAVTEFVTQGLEHGQPWFFEQRLPEFFGVQGKVIELTDFDEYINQQRRQLTGKNIVRELKYYEPRLIWRLTRQLGAISAPLTLNKSLLELFRKIRDQHGSEIAGIAYMQGLRDIVKLPEPLDIEASLVLNSKDKERNSNIIADRSFIQAGQVLSNVSSLWRENTSLPMQAGMVVGDLHRSQVRYMLTHPDYDPHLSVKEAMTLSGTR